MSVSGRRTVMTLVLLAAFILQLAFGSDLKIRSAKPNLALTTLLVECLFAGPNTGSALGFFLGLLESSYAAVYVGSIVVTRTLAGFGVGALEDRVYRDNLFVAMAVVLLGTAATECLFFLFAPQPNAHRWAAAAAGECLYNTVLAVPAYWLIGRLVRARTSV